MTLQPSINWILAPVLAAIEYVAEETKVSGLLKRSLIHIEMGRPLLQFASKQLVEIGEPNAVAAVSRLLAEAPIQEEWAKELRSSDYATLNAHSLVSIWGVLESCLENLVVLILTNDTGILQNLASAGIKFDSSRIYHPLCEEEARAFYKKIENYARVKGNVVLTYEAVLALFGLSASCPQYTDSLLEANALRNCIMHRGGIIDKKAITQAAQLNPWFGKRYHLGSDDYFKYHDAVGAWLTSLLGSVIESKYVANHGS